MCFSAFNVHLDLTLSTVAAQSPTSDNDGGERPIRQQLKNTNIESTNGSAHINRKRALEDADASADEHPTKRSREGTPESTAQVVPETEVPETEDSTALEDLPSENGASVSESEFGSDPTPNPVDFVAQSPSLQSLPAEASWNVDGNASCVPTSTTINLPLDLAITISCAGAQMTQRLSVPLEVNINIPSEVVRAASSWPGEAKSHISISSDTSAASIQLQKGYPRRDLDSQRDSDSQRDPDYHAWGYPRRDPDYPRASTYPQASTYSQASTYPQASPYPRASTYPQASAHSQSAYLQDAQYPHGSSYPRATPYPRARTYPRASDYFEEDYVYPSASSYAHARARTLATESLRDSDKGTPQKPSDTEAKQNDQPNDSKTKTQEHPANTEEEKSNVSSVLSILFSKLLTINQAFKASAFGQAVSGSPFAVGTANSSSSPFLTKKPNSAPLSFASSAFSSATSASPSGFASAAPSGFGVLGSGSKPLSGSPFGSAFAGKTGKITSFASPDAPPLISEPKNKQLGAAQPGKEEIDNESEAGPKDTSGTEKTDVLQPKKTGMPPGTPCPTTAGLGSYSSQDSVETGEEDETTQFIRPAKLFSFDAEWKERGMGQVKVNTKTNPDGASSSRIIMREHATHRLILNCPIFDGMTRDEPTNNRLILANAIDGKVSGLLALRVCSPPDHITCRFNLMLTIPNSSVLQNMPLNYGMFSKIS